MITTRDEFEDIIDNAVSNWNWLHQNDDDFIEFDTALGDNMVDILVDNNTRHTFYYEDYVDEYDANELSYRVNDVLKWWTDNYSSRRGTASTTTNNEHTVTYTDYRRGYRKLKNKDEYVNFNDISPKFYGNPNNPRNSFICYKSKEKAMEASIKKVIFNNPATIVLWEDGTKTVVKAGPYDIYDPEKGLAMCLVKKQLGNKGNYYELFKKFMACREVVLASNEGLVKNMSDSCDLKKRAKMFLDAREDAEYRDRVLEEYDKRTKNMSEEELMAENKRLGDQIVALCDELQNKEDK